MKTTFKRIIEIIVVLVLVHLFCFSYSYYLDSKIDDLYKIHQVSVNHVSGLSEKDKGNFLIDKAMTTSNMFVMGSSELGSGGEYNIKEYFPNNKYDGDASFVGHAYVQNALHAMDLAANYEKIKDKDLVIVESIQWFMDNDIDGPGFFSNFSELQFYEFLHNEKLSESTKRYLCERYVQIEADNIEGETHYYSQTYILAKLYIGDSLWSKTLYALIKPYYGERYLFLKLKDQYNSYQYLKSLPLEEVQKERTINWSNEYKKAEKSGEKAVTNNDFYVNDDYYNEYLADGIEDKRNNLVDRPLMVSNEWNDYQFFIKVCEELDLHPYIVIMSTNGLWYDYCGWSKETRDTYYNKVDNIAEENGLSTLNLKDKEYEPYFYVDVMHLGWKGWPYVTENVLKHYAK